MIINQINPAHEIQLPIRKENEVTVIDLSYSYPFRGQYFNAEVYKIILEMGDGKQEAFEFHVPKDPPAFLSKGATVLIERNPQNPNYYTLTDLENRESKGIVAVNQVLPAYEDDLPGWIDWIDEPL